MKKLGILIAGIMVAGSWVHAQTNQVLSRNAVGYIKTTLETGKLYLVRHDFESIDGSVVTVSNLIGNQLPNSSSVLLWNRNASAYVAENKTRSGWSPGTNQIDRGFGFFVKSGGTVPTNIFLMGEVPDDTTAPSTTVNNVTGLAMFGFPYPVAVQWTNTQLAVNSQSGDSLLLWDETNQQYIAYNRTRSGWGTGTNVVLQPGQGFWFRTSATQQWTEVKPYTWP